MSNCDNPLFFHEWLKRIETFKLKLQQNLAPTQFHSQFLIPGDSEGYGYEKIFQPFLDSKVTQVEIEEPYIRKDYQCWNFVRFCEIVRKHAVNLKVIKLTTGEEEKEKQEKNLDALQTSLDRLKITLSIIKYKTDLHDREIKFDNGWTVKIGRGLDYLDRPAPFTVEIFDKNLCKCKETKVDAIYDSIGNPLGTETLHGKADMDTFSGSHAKSLIEEIEPVVQCGKCSAAIKIHVQTSNENGPKKEHYGVTKSTSNCGAEEVVGCSSRDIPVLRVQAASVVGAVELSFNNEGALSEQSWGHGPCSTLSSSVMQVSNPSGNRNRKKRRRSQARQNDQRLIYFVNQPGLSKYNVTFCDLCGHHIFCNIYAIKDYIGGNVVVVITCANCSQILSHWFLD